MPRSVPACLLKDMKPSINRLSTPSAASSCSDQERAKNPRSSSNCSGSTMKAPESFVAFAIIESSQTLLPRNIDYGNGNEGSNCLRHWVTSQVQVQQSRERRLSHWETEVSSGAYPCVGAKSLP